jgi:hypothetical protein
VVDGLRYRERMAPDGVALFEWKWGRSWVESGVDGRLWVGCGEYEDQGAVGEHQVAGVLALMRIALALWRFTWEQIMWIRLERYCFFRFNLYRLSEFVAIDTSMRLCSSCYSCSSIVLDCTNIASYTSFT